MTSFNFDKKFINTGKLFSRVAQVFHVTAAWNQGSNPRSQRIWELFVPENATRATVKALYEAYAGRDPDRVAALIHDDIEWIIYGPVQVFPFHGPRRGKAQVLDALAAIGKDYLLERYVPEIIIVEDDRAAVVSDAAFKQRATGRTLTMRLANFLRFRDGLLVEFREFSDTFDVVEQALGKWIEV